MNLEITPQNHWKYISILLLLLISALFFLYVFAARSRKKLSRKLALMHEENETLQEMLYAFEALKKNDAEEFMQPAPGLTGYRTPILNPGLRFNIQPAVDQQLPVGTVAFTAWNNVETLRVEAVLDHNGVFGRFRSEPDLAPFPAWVFQLLTTDGVLLKESRIPIEGQRPDGKQIVSAIRHLLELSLEPDLQTPNP